MLSAVMTTYNPNEFLEEQLDSIRLQTRPVDELIIVDDASSNDAPERIRNYIDTYQLENWKLIPSEENQGFVGAFRKALSQASGDVIILSDQDDIWKKDKAEKMERTFSQNPCVLALASAFDMIDENGKIIPVALKKGKSNANLLRRTVKKGGLNHLNYADIAVYNCSPGCTGALRRSIRDQYLQFEGDLPHDWAVFAIAALEGGLYFLDLPLTEYRQHSSNTYGLKHLSTLKERSRRADRDWIQKKALSRLVHQFAPGSEDEKTARRAENLFEQRRRNLENASVGGCLRLLAESGAFPFFYETAGADLKAVLSSRLGKN